MKNICKILLNESNTEYQIISWDPNDGKLYSNVGGEIDGYSYDSIESAVDACAAMWGSACWDLEWIDD